MKNYSLITVFITALLLAACGTTVTPAPLAATPQAPAEPEAATVDEAPAPATEVALVEPSVIPVEALRNATYNGIYEKPVTLTDGLYEGEPFVETDPAKPVVEYIDGVELYGDLDGDGVEDAVVFLLERTGGSGAFTYVAAQLNRDGQPVDAGAVRIEDRIGVKSVAIKGDQVVMEIITQGPGDAACCGSHKIQKTYALQDDQLVEVAGENQASVRISAADLNDTNWTLVELYEGQPVLTDTEVTISFSEGLIAGVGGCNNYTSSFSLSEDNPFVMTTGPVAATKKACPDPITNQEIIYFKVLEGVSQWNYFFGRLALYYGGDQGGLERLLFDHQADTLTGQTWQWVSYTNPIESYEIESPENYTLMFNEDGTVSISADCNLANGSYTDEDGSLQVQIGPMTMAQCPAESRSDQFIQFLGFATRYFFKDGNLYLDLFADGGTLEFMPAK